MISYPVNNFDFDYSYAKRNEFGAPFRLINLMNVILRGIMNSQNAIILLEHDYNGEWSEVNIDIYEYCPDNYLADFNSLYIPNQTSLTGAFLLLRELLTDVRIFPVELVLVFIKQNGKNFIS